MTSCPHRLEPAPLHVADCSSFLSVVSAATIVANEAAEIPTKIPKVLEVEHAKPLNTILAFTLYIMSHFVL